jgi:hypothetical protein
MNKPGMFPAWLPLRLSQPRRLSRCLLALAVAGAWLGPGAYAADRADLAQAQQVYQQERAACLAGRTGQDRDSCLREAQAALKEASSARADDPAQLERNRLRRCDDLAAQAREACLRMMRGEGEQGGSVEGGGIVRRIVTVLPAPSGAASAPGR